MTSEWERQHLDELVAGVLRDVRQVDESHHFGRPFMTAYQLAVKLQQRHREAANALHPAVGGSGTGSHNSLAQTLARELSRRIKQARDRGETYPVEGAFLSNDGITNLTYANPGEDPVESSLTGRPEDLALFRLRSRRGER
jgi:predicted ArsR family transcriptional regulator